MFINRIFYTIKPLIPRQTQIFLRRRVAAHKRKKYARIWPINPNAAAPPEGWQGWPDDKNFALVLSHDVDTRKGYENCLKLADLEERMGFRSSFNFVPELYGRVSHSLLDQLRERGFDVAVHGLKHDGKLFRSRRIFNRRATKINAYLKEWQTRGFTSPSMHHNLDWLTALDIDYAISTFDTDPFEPQPDAVERIFPFWYSKRSPNEGFVELPYTLPQDFTLFIILQETTIDIWKRKIDWIAEQGGMALVNVHPDYMNLSNDRVGNLEYTANYYADFLQYLKDRYTDSYYHAKPREIANFYKQQNLPSYLTSYSTNQAIQPNKLNQLSKLNQLNKPSESNQPSQPNKLNQPRHPLNVCMLTYSFYESDGRVRRYAETLARRGDKVDVISLRRAGQSDYNELNGIRVHRIQERTRDEKNKFDYLWRVLKFFIRSALLLTRKHLKKPYDIVHVHSVPDFEVFAALASKLLGARVILDIHDIVPELYASKFDVKRDSMAFKTLVFLEKLSIGFSDHVIISNDIWRETLVERSVRSDKCTAILNYPDNTYFYWRKPASANGKIIFLYPGTLNLHQGLDIAISAFAQIKDEIEKAELHIYGDGPAKPQLDELIRQYGLDKRVLLKEPVSIEEISEIMARADVGIIPKKNTGFGGEAFSTKTLEFMSLGVPIIVSRTKIDRYYFNDSIVSFFEPENEQDLAEVMLRLIKNHDMREKQADDAFKFVEDNSWDVKKRIYLDLIDKLTELNL